MLRFLLGLFAAYAIGFGFHSQAQISQAPALIGQRGITLPVNCQIGQLFWDSDATAGQNLHGCTAANTWKQLTGSGATIGGTDTQVCFNDGGVLSCGDAGLTYNKTTDTLAVGGSVKSGAAASGAGVISAVGLIAQDRAVLISPADGIWKLMNNAGTDFFRLQFGGDTAASPALRKNGSALEAVAADNSAYAPFNAQAIVAADRLVTTNPTAGIGYATGAGGTVTQLTSKATAATCSKVSCEITMNGEALAANTTVSFTLTNTAVVAVDQLLCTHHSAGTIGAYTVTAFPGAGSATVALRNVTAGSLSEAVVLKCQVFKGATS